jgi:uncharacterized membrane protein
MRLLAAFLRDERASMAVMFAGALILGAIACAFAIDEGSLYYERRVMQSGADLAALQAARDPSNATSIARGALIEAGLITGIETGLNDPLSPRSMVVEAGQYVADASQPAAQRFKPGLTPYNAVRVRYRQRGGLYFARLWSEPPMMSVEAVATTTPEVAFSVGSRLLSLKDGVANALLNGLLGTNINIAAASYNALLNARVSAFSFLDALASELNIAAGTYADVLRAKADHGVIARALAATLNGTEKTAMQTIAAAAGHNGKVEIGKLFDLGRYANLALGTGETGVFTKVSALEMLSVSAALSDGTHQVALNAGISVPGLVGASVKLAVGEPPQGGSWYAIGPAGTIVRTAQVRLKVNVKMSLDILNLGLVASVLSLLGIPHVFDVDVPIYVEVANAEAQAVAATCPVGNATSGTATIAVRPGAARIVLGEVSDAAMANFGAFPAVGEARLINVLGVLTATGSAHVQVAQMQPKLVTFSAAEIAAGTIKSVSTTTIAQSLMTSLLSTLTLDVKVLGLLGGLLSNVLAATGLTNLLSPLGAALDPVLSGLLSTLGVKVGEADVRVYGVRCAPPVLVG